jgi:autotransporter-associated beta strand protein
MMNTKLVTLLIVHSAFTLGAFAGSATWNLNPTSGDWNTATNWVPNAVPNGPSDVATCATSNSPSITLSSEVELNAIVFNAGASAFTISATPADSLTISGAGITNNSSATQHFVLNQDQTGDYDGIVFSNSAVVGSDMLFSVHGGEEAYYGYGAAIHFDDTSSAGNGTFDVLPGIQNSLSSGSIGFHDDSTAANAVINVYGGHNGNGDLFFTDDATAANATLSVRGILFFWVHSNAGNSTITNNGYFVFRDQSSASNATIINNPSTANGLYNSGGTNFWYTATAGDSTIINNGSTGAGTYGGFTGFNYESPTAGNATLIAYGGIDGGSGGKISFQVGDGGTARIEVFGDGNLDISEHPLPGLTIGSLEGDGLVFLGANKLTVGANSLSTTFAGLLQDTGSLAKIGSGTLTLSGANSYTGGTSIDGGFLLVGNTSGSGTGSGTVQAMTGTLGGNGIISGSVTIGTGHGAGAGLGPGKNSVTPGTLTIKRKLTLMRDATYKVTLNSDQLVADKVTARGVKIRGAQITFLDLGANVLPLGTVFTVISNTAATPITGTFSNLPDGSLITVGSNTFQANYKGGDGNDLTLTVVP